MQIKNHIPNLITLLNLFCGCIALVFVAENNYLMAFCMVSLGIFLDFFDGFFARLFKVASPLGLQLDSLADMVTSGVVPGFVMFKMLVATDKTLINKTITNCWTPFFETPWYAYLGFVITLGACFRLANFNIDTRQSDSFIGLPTPANALFILSLPLINEAFFNDNFCQLIFTKWVLFFITILSAYIMNAELPLFSLKIKSFNYKNNVLQIVFLLISILVIALFQFLGVAIVIVFYVFLSIIMNIVNKK